MLWFITTSFTKTATPQFIKKTTPAKPNANPKPNPYRSLYLAFILTSLAKQC